MKNVHITDNYLLNPQHEITVTLIGCGGTGSQVFTCLGRMHSTLKALNHPGLFVRVYDPDIVTLPNVGRQLFSEADLGLNKAACMASRVNRFLGTNWISDATEYDGEPANIIITCTDNISSRLYVEKVLYLDRNKWNQPYLKNKYWLDFGNTRSTGQVVLGSLPIEQPESKKFRTVDKLKFVTELFDYSTVQDIDSGPSCSLAEALNKQDLFINSALAQLGCNILWKLFREGLIDHQGLFLNLDNMKVNPIKIEPHEHKIL